MTLGPWSLASGPGRAIGSVLLLFVASVVYGSVSALVLGDAAHTQAGLLAGLVLQEVAVVGGLTLLFLHAAGRDLRFALGCAERPGRWAIAVLLGAPAFVVLQAPVLQAWSEAIGAVEPRWYSVALGIHSPLQGLMVALGVVVAPAVFEELAFRGYLLRELLPVGPARAVALQAVLFGLYHADLFGAPIYLAAGALLGVIRLRSGALWPAIVFHAINNGLGVLDWNLGSDHAWKPGGGLLGAAALAAAASVAVLRPSRTPPT